jgi:prevent-host-death family protein
MVVNVVEAKSKFSALLSLVGMGKEEVVIAKRNKPMAVLVPFDTFQRMKENTLPHIDMAAIDALPSTIDRFQGILSDEEIETDWKESREAYLRDKYL